jgi:DNA-binding transcriptional LysR family regulator
VLPRLPESLDQHPQLEIELTGTDRIVDVVREGFDCVLRVGTVDDSALAAAGPARCRSSPAPAPRTLRAMECRKNWEISTRIGWCITFRRWVRVHRASNIRR